MTPRTRRRITGTFTTTAPMHVGSGEVTEDERLLNEKNDATCDVQAVAKDYRGRPCIPGTALKGVLRAWAEAFYPGHPALDRVFGRRDATVSGRAEFHTVLVPEGTAVLAEHPHVPYWNAKSGTGIASSVGINRTTGAADRHKLFFHEFVPEGTTFAVEITAAGLAPDDVALLLAVLEHGAAHPTHPYQFGAGGADGWGRVTWTPTAEGTAGLPPLPAPTASPPAHQAFALPLAFDGPFLVNDASRTRRTENDGLPHFTPLRRAGGGVWLPAASFRGVLRARAELLWRSLRPDADLGPVEEIFGTTQRSSRLTITEFAEDGRAAEAHQDFVAIDRFTGGAADGAKFEARYADRPKLTTTLTLTTAGLAPDARWVFAAALRDVCAGRLTFGAGGSKGYGAARGTLTGGEAWVTAELARFAVPPAPRAAPPAAAAALVSDVLDVEVNPGGKPRRFLRSRRPAGKSQPVAPWKELSRDIQADDTLGSFDVEYELADGQPVRVRRKGRSYTDPDPAPAGRPAPAAPGLPPARADAFAHPYYFLRMAHREEFTGELADAPPSGHDRLLPDHYSGRLRVRLTTATPLLLCDTSPGSAAEGPPGHFTYRVRRGADDRPLLAAASVRGMLRAAYEAVTNSRFGVFHGHEDRLGLRMATDEGLGLVPCRVSGGQIHLMPGTSRVTGGRPGGPMYGAWLPIDLKVAGGAVHPAHRQPVCCWIELWRRTPWDRWQNRFREDQAFDYWKVLAVAPHATPVPEPARTLPRPRKNGENHHTPLGQPVSFVEEGYVCRTGYNFDRKHDERVFFSTPPPGAAPRPQPLDAAGHAAAWANLIRNYRTNQDLVNGKPRPGALQRAGWSRHMTEDQELELTEGSLAYARVDAAGRVTELYPVMISRKLFPQSPRQRLPESLLPATAHGQLSPADRVFGWVSQQAASDCGEAAHRSLVRVGPVACERADAIDPHTPPVPLAILGQAKPAQGRFYLGNRDGFAQAAGGTKEERGYRDGNRVRGPKVYPHHRRGLDPEHYRSPPGPKQRSNQNRSVAEWVKEGTAFAFDLHVLNLSAVELGALVWLLSRPAGQHLRLGLGKPLGFGSVRAEWVPAESCVAAGAAWVAALPAGEPPPADLTAARADFVTGVAAANPDLLKAFETAAAGFPDLAVHYPPPQPALYPPRPGEEGGKHYQWFGANEMVSRDRNGLRRSLPDLTGDPSLPVTPIR